MEKYGKEMAAAFFIIYLLVRFGCLYTLGAVTVAWAGFAWFQKTRKGFADVL
jgi:hypothetical protein